MKGPDILIKALEDSREERLGDLYSELKIDRSFEDKEIELGPESGNLELISLLFKNKKGRFTVKELIDEYYRDSLGDGTEVGMAYGTKFIVQDIQNGKITLNKLKKMSDNEITLYLNEHDDEMEEFLREHGDELDEYIKKLEHENE